MTGESQTTQELAGKKAWMMRAALVVGLVLVLVGIGMGLKSLLASKPGNKKPVTTIKILPDTPPPPPPPPKEPPKEQPKEQPKEIKMEQPKPQEAPQPPAEALKMEGAAGDGPSPFSAGTVNNDYKGGDVGTKIGGKKGMAAYAGFTGQIKARIEEALAARKELEHAQYRLVLHVWFTRDGLVERVELQGSSGTAATDDLIRKTLAEMGPVGESMPEDMPQPVKLRITSKNAG